LAKGFNDKKLVEQDEAWLAWLEDRFADRLKHFVADAAIEHPDDAPHAQPGAILLAQ